MNFHNNNQIKSRTIDNINNQNSSRRKPNKFSKSQTTSNLHKYELFNKRNRLKNYIINNNSNSSSEKDDELYDEEINYNIDSLKNIHDTTNCTNLQKDHKKDDSNTINIEDVSDKNIAQRDFWLEEKNSYIQELEKKIKKQNNIINGLLNNDNSSNTKLSNYQDKTSNSNSLLDYNSQNKKMLNKNFVKKEQKSKTFLDEFTNNEFNINETTNNSIKYSNKSKISNSINKPKDKYDTLYSKYLNLLNDFKYLNNNNNNEKNSNKLRGKYNSLLEENKNLKSKLKSKNKIIKNQQKEITDIKNQKTKNNEEEKDLIKKLREQTETFRKDLVLSQAMVNSLKAEIEVLKKANNSNKIKNSNKKNRNSNKDNNLIDKYNFTFNNNNNQSPPLSPSNNVVEKINKTNYFNNNDYPSNDLIISLNNKNKLLTKVLQENNLLRNKLKKFDSFLPNFIDICDEDDIEEINKENLIKKYEEKFQYFSFYIKKIKMLINDIFKDIPSTLNKYLNKNNFLSEKFILGLYDLRKEYYTIKKIDEFNLDSTDDEKCIKIYKNLIRLLNKELELFTNNINSNTNLNDNALSNLSNLSSYNINNSIINNNSRYFENEIKNENDINFINNLNSKKRLNLTDLNIGKIEEEKNNIFNLNSENKFKSFNGEINKKVNNRRITYITNYGNKNRNKSSINKSYNNEYFFEYGSNINNKFN